MNDSQEVKLSMFNAVRDYILVNGAGLNDLPSFSDFSEQFSSIIDQLENVRLEQERRQEGNAVEKAELKNELVTVAYAMSRNIVAYANLTGKSNLSKEVNYTKTELRNATDTVLKARCRIISQLATDNLENLEIFNVTEASITALETKIADFLAAMSKPKTARTNRKLVTEKLKSLLDQGDALLKYKIDVLVDMVELPNFELYNGYRSARALINEYGRHRLAVIINVTDAAGVPLPRVTATVEGSPVTKKTTDKGSFHVDHMPEGIYIFNFNKNGYKPLSARVIVNSGETTRMDVVMDAIPEYSGVLA